MIPKDPVFPLFRRTADGKHFYRIEALDRFTEIQRVGGRAVLHTVRATLYPERVRVMEMIDDATGRYMVMPSHEWDDLLGQYGLVQDS